MAGGIGDKNPGCENKFSRTPGACLIKCFTLASPIYYYAVLQNKTRPSCRVIPFILFKSNLNQATFVRWKAWNYFMHIILFVSSSKHSSFQRTAFCVSSQFVHIAPEMSKRKCGCECVRERECVTVNGSGRECGWREEDSAGQLLYLNSSVPTDWLRV